MGEEGAVRKCEGPPGLVACPADTSVVAAGLDPSTELRPAIGATDTRAVAACTRGQRVRRLISRGSD